MNADLRPRCMSLPRTLLLPAGLALVLLPALAACGSNGTTPGGGDDVQGAPQSKPPAAATYVVTGVTDGGEKRDLAPGSEIRFTLDGKTFGISAGCNSMGGAYTLDGTRLTVTGIGGTDMGCDQALMDQDTWVAGLFDEPVQLTTGKEASIISGDVVLALAPREEVHPDKPLAGTYWQLDGITTGSGPDGMSSSVPGDVVAWFRIDGDQVLLFDGCNGGGGTVTVSGDSVTWGDLATDKRACLGDADQVAAAVQAVLTGTSTYAITEDSLTLSADDQGLTFRAVAEKPATR